jgi:hypothetical protein
VRCRRRHISKDSHTENNFILVWKGRAGRHWVKVTVCRVYWLDSCWEKRFVRGNRGQSFAQTAAVRGTNRWPENRVTETVQSWGRVWDKSIADGSRRLLLLVLLFWLWWSWLWIMIMMIVIVMLLHSPFDLARNLLSNHTVTSLCHSPVYCTVQRPFVSGYRKQEIIVMNWSLLCILQCRPTHRLRWPRNNTRWSVQVQSCWLL